MKKHNNTPLVALNGNNKDSHYLPQLQRVSNAFFEKPKTMLQVSLETNIYRSNICRYKSKWLKSDNIAVAKIGVCPISKRTGVQFLTTNPDLYPKQRQLNLFESINTQ